MDYIIDQDGKKEVIGSFKLLYEGNESEQYLEQKEQDEQTRLEEERHRPPTTEERVTQLETLVVNNISNQIEQQIMRGGEL